jgi:hypothetical protein
MTTESSRARRLAIARWALLVLAVLASAAAATVVGFAAYLLGAGYTAPSDPQSPDGMVSAIGYALFVIVGLPVSFVCAASWVGYFAVTSRSRRPY